MKMAICSDLHLEFGELQLKNEQNADLLILSGDICLATTMNADVNLYSYGSAAKKRDEFISFFKQVCSEFKHVIYIMGNHEHYHYDFVYTGSTLKKNLEFLENLHVLDKETLKIDNVTFIGGTLWTDFNNEDELTLHQIGRMMNDFRCVKNSANQVGYWVEEDGKRARKHRDSVFSPNDALQEHRAMLKLITDETDQKFDQKFVVVGHHAPSRLSTHPRYADDVIMNGGYSSDLNQFIMDRPQIKLWTHGHTHDDYDYMLRGTRIVCNPRGYIGHEERADNFTLKYVEV